MKYVQYGRGCTAAILCYIICLTCMLRPIYAAAAESRDIPDADDVWQEEPAIGAESGVVMEVSTGAVLFEKNMHDVHYPASITKIMTVLLAIENCDMEEIVTVPPEAVYMEDKGTHIALDEGEQLTVEQCLYAVMLASANDAAYALAEHVGGAAENFIGMMNERAKELGCLNTNFTNPHGLPDENHITSAYDMALITKAAVEYDIFRRISGTSYYEIPPSEHQKDLICMYNHHKMIGKGGYYDEEVFAGKNGYTDAAGNTLVTCAERDDMDIICVVMKTQGDQIYQDTIGLLSYGLDCFSKEKIDETAEHYEKMLQNENPIYENCSVLSVTDPAFVVIPNGWDVSDLTIDFIYDETEGNVEAKYYCSGHFAGTVHLAVTGILPEKDSIEETMQIEASEEKENGKDRFNWKYILFSGSIGGFAVGVALLRNKSHRVRRSRYGRKRRRKNKGRVRK